VAKGNPQMPYQVPDLENVKDYENLLSKIEQRSKQISEWKDTAKSKQSQLNKQAEKELAIFQKIYEIEGKKGNLMEKSNKLSGTLLNQLSKVSGKGQDFAKSLEDAAKSGDVAFVEAGNNFADLLDKVNKGDMGPGEIANALATTDFGPFQDSVEQMYKTMKKTPSLQSILKVKSETFSAINGLFGGMLGTIRSIIAAAGPIGLLIAAIGLVVKYLVETVKRGIELRRELGTSAVATAKIQINMEKAAFAAAMYGGTMQQGRDAVKALVVETGLISDITGESAIAMGKFVANTGVGGGEAAKLAKALRLVNGQSLATNLNLLSSVDNLAEANGIVSSKVFQDLASNTELFARAGAAGAQSLSKAAIEAAKIGTSLSALDQIADNLLDVQQTIRRSQQLSRLLGKNIDLTRAISLANDPSQISALQQELQNVFAGSGDAIARNRFVQNQLKQLFPSLQDFNAIVNGQVNTEQVKPPEAKDQLEAQNSTNEILSKQANDIKLLREQNKELLEKMNSNISRLRR